MKRKRMILLLAMSLAVTSVNGMTVTAGAADLVSDPVIETDGLETEEVEAVETPEVEETEDADIDFMDGDTAERGEETDGLEVTGDVGTELTSEVAESDGEDKKSVVPDRGITRLDENYIYTVDITEPGDHKWFSFTPEEDGKYKFYSTGDFDTFGYFFDSKDYCGELWEYSGDYFHYNDEGQGMENNFEFIRDLQAGKTYYYCVGLSGETGSFDVIFRKVKEIKNIHATLNRNKIEAGMDNGLSATLQYTFADGSVKTAELNANDWSVSDKDVLDTGTTDIKIIDSEGNENAYGKALTKGKYKVIFSAGNVQSEALEFEATDIEDAGFYYGELKEGENPGTKVPANGRSFYKFIPLETQRYIFENCGRLWIYHKNKDGSLEEIGDGYWDRPLLQKKEEYYFRLMDIDEFNLKIYREPSLTSILFTPYSTEVYEPVVYDGIVGFFDRQIRGDLVFLYDNRDPEEIKNIDLLNGWGNHYLNKIETVIKDENGQNVSADNGLSVGKYEVYLKCGDIESTPYTFTVIPFEYEKLPQLKTGTNKITTERWYAFSPAFTETYDISLNNDKYEVNWYYLNEDGEIQSCYADDGKEMELDKNKKYLIYFYHENSDKQEEECNYIISKSGDCRWEETEVTAATCTEDGEIKETCSVHGETRRKVIRKLGHELGKRQITKTATCGATGESARICSRCNAKLEKQTVKATGKHKFSAWKTTKAATALAEGQKERICSVCKKKETQKIARLKATLTLSITAKKTLPLKLNRSYKVNAQMTKGDRVLYWRSSNTKAVTVDKYGKVTGKQAGKTARITVKLRSGLTTWFDVKVQKTDVATTSLKLKNASTGKYVTGSAILKVKQQLKVTPVLAPVTSIQTVTYATSNKKVATVASNGQIVAKAKGTAYITAKSGRKYVRVKITVK